MPEKFSTFYIENFQFSKTTLIAQLHYSFDKKVSFIEEIDFSCSFPISKQSLENKENLETFLFPILIAFWISYYKLNPTEEIIVEAGNLDNRQKEFWKKFYTNGLGEFFYKNNIDFTHLCNFSSTNNKLFSSVLFSPSEKYLVPIWGGKDSIVTTILLEEEWIVDITPFIFGKSDQIKNDFLDIYEKKEILIKRKLSPNLFELNQLWYYNGHVPITGLISFILVFVSYLYDYKYIVFSNERSANIGNTLFYGNLINHQYSKSLEFEQDFQAYLGTYISPNIVYNSKLREFSELKIAQIFAEKWKRYFKIFSSCNANFKIIPWEKIQSRWCNNCPKCLFVYIIMRPFLTEEETHSIWEQELYNRNGLENLYKEIIWLEWCKPFECVWEIEEAQLASALAKEKFTKIPRLLEVFETYLPQLDIPTLESKYL